MKQIPVICPKALEKYNGKSVVLRVELNGRLVTMQGKFRVLEASEAEVFFLDIENLKSDNPIDDASILGSCIHLSQGHADSIKPANDSLKQIDFLVESPFLSRHFQPSD
ncbi:MAG: hypothetical protein ABR955_05010 [Verrucomicrobiota bacterium]|jgi:hypothetical protein